MLSQTSLDDQFRALLNELISHKLGNKQSCVQKEIEKKQETPIRDKSDETFPF